MIGSAKIATPNQLAADPDLGPCFVLPPSCGYSLVDRVLSDLGFRADAAEGGAGEAGSPVAAGWTAPEGRPFVGYTGHPVLGMKSLDVATLSPSRRAEVALRLPLARLDALDKMLLSSEPASVLSALWGLSEREEISRLEILRDLEARQVPPITAEIRRVITRLEAVERNRQELLGGLRLVAESAAEVIRDLRDPRLLKALLATPDDCAALFAREISENVAGLLRTRALDTGRGMEGELRGSEDVTAAQAGLFRWHNSLSNAFPLGYREVAGWLSRDTVWVCWKTTGAGGATITYDGLVLAEGRWRLFPRPFRILGQAIAQQVAARPARARRTS